ncbi:hypothetical protein CHIBA101_1763 [Actinomyces sp. Chiba101]|uniref:Fluoroquinolone transport system permease protein n=1 Tax=Actinomyces denticolens TaxID=52767 RepID=A0ABY1HZ24_9ACTO|nr:MULTISPECIES: hypothetical protein [Actinomyces]BAW93598.1 hypothetical protein CHIBA101_1763 [Actinomyces sp. Chiba101]GAV93555.1 hypothetical protein ADENT20671_0301 [Actinomyces denticolens]SHI33823.1 hypothetical protein SAMN05216246_101279 [Actinomyces denticolens]SUU74556.1 Fluoroquinolones export permease protein Rv2686c/MT2760 [Actinomyces denticolens]
MSAPALRRTAATVRLDLRLQAAGGYWLVAVAVGLVIALLLRGLTALPPRWWPVLLLGEMTITCFYFAAVQVLAERGDGSLMCRAVSPMRVGEYLVALTASLGLLAVVESAVLVLVSGTAVAWPAFLAGVALLAVLEVLYGAAAVAGYRSAASFLLPSGVWTIGFAVPVLPLLGAAEGWGYWLHPLQGPVVLLRIAVGQAPATLAAPAVLAAAVWSVAGLAVAGRRLRGAVTDDGAGGSRRRAAGSTVHWDGLAGDRPRRGRHPLRLRRRQYPDHTLRLRSPQCLRRPGGRRSRTVGVLAALVPMDMRRLARDDLLWWLALLPLVMILGVRLGAGPAAEVLRAHGLDEAAWLEPLVGLVLTVVLPVMIGTVVGFMLLQDKEEATWQMIAVTPLSLHRYLGWRAGQVAVISVPAVAAGLAWCAGTGWGRAAGMALACAPLASATALALAAFATGTVQGVAAVKLGLLILVLPVLDHAGSGGRAPWLAVVPTWWPLRALDAMGGGAAWLPWAAGALGWGIALATGCLWWAGRSRAAARTAP